MRIVHIITCLDVGGAQKQLINICLNDKENEHIIISLWSKKSKFYKEVDRSIRVHYLDLLSKKNYLISLINLFKLLKNLKPDIVQTWLFQADLIGGIISRLANIRIIIWSIRSLPITLKEAKLTSVIINRLCILFSYIIPTSSIACGQVALNEHLKIGYNRKIVKVIPNGVDISKFKPSKKLKTDFRNRFLKKGDEAINIGMVARYDKHKDFNTILKALNIIKNEYKINFFLVGPGLDRNNNSLNFLIDKNNLSKEVKLIGAFHDLPLIMNGLDIHILSSFREGFPNVVLESMACNTISIASNVGESAHIIGSYGKTFEVNNYKSLVACLEEILIKINKNERGKDLFSPRSRIIKKFSNKIFLERIKKEYESLISNIM